MSQLRSDLPVQISIVNPLEHINVLGLRHLLPARWWSPGKCHIRFGFFVLHIPRRWWPCRKDGVRKCASCGRQVWMEGPPMSWCDDCARLARQLQGMFEAPSWWLSSLRMRAKREDWFKA